MNRTIRIGMLAITLIVGTAAISSGLFASAVGGGPHGGRMGHRGDKLEALDLTEDQKSRIETIRARFETQLAPLHQQMEALHEQKQAARESGGAAAHEALRAQAKPLHQQMRAAHDAMDTEIRAVLTTEQIAKLDAMRVKGGGGRHGRGGTGGHCNGSEADGSKEGSVSKNAPSTGSQNLK